MTIKSNIVIEIQKNERTYTFSMPMGCPFGEAYDAAFAVLKDITELSQQAVDNAKPKDHQHVEV